MPQAVRWSAMLDPTAWPGHGQWQSTEPGAYWDAHRRHHPATKTPTAAGLTRTTAKARKRLTCKPPPTRATGKATGRYQSHFWRC